MSEVIEIINLSSLLVGGITAVNLFGILLIECIKRKSLRKPTRIFLICVISYFIFVSLTQIRHSLKNVNILSTIIFLITIIVLIIFGYYGKKYSNKENQPIYYLMMVLLTTMMITNIPFISGQKTIFELISSVSASSVIILGFFYSVYFLNDTSSRRNRIKKVIGRK